MVTKKASFLILFISAIFLANTTLVLAKNSRKSSQWLQLKNEDLHLGAHHTQHFKIFSKYTSGYNLQVLKAIDKVQSHAMDGGTYFIGIDSIPAESPVYYELRLFNKSLITPPRKSSYCSGSSYTAFIETLNQILMKKKDKLTEERFEALRMQEPNGGRREDWVKFWGIWNGDGFGTQFAMVQYAAMGKEIKPEDAKPGDFVNISWKTGIGHSVIFLGWYIDKNNVKNMVYWSSQKGTNGYGDQVVPLEKIEEVKFVRLTNPDNLFKFDIKKEINKNIPGDKINW
ncbi:MAG: hypothetical protein Q8933_15705 [Bacteroidota bacterium]|nr:hypothetical protein [Bacteroidota bacterium]MDP4193558.1 hypothetical protein [Bacteroidota bacterium]